jgi:hypothetical protein
MNKIFNKKLTFILGLLILSLAMPISAQAAPKKKQNLTVSTNSPNVAIKKSGTNKYSVKLTEKTKNVSLRVKDNKKNITKRCKYKSSNKKIVSMKNNKLTAKKAGKCKVTITYKNKKTTLNVNVVKTPTIKCNHTWKENWAVLEEEYDENDGPFYFCYCGNFQSEDEYKQHIFEISTKIGITNPSAKTREIGIHGTKANSVTDSRTVGDKTIITLTTKYIKSRTCTKCGKKITVPW